MTQKANQARLRERPLDDDRAKRQASVKNPHFHLSSSQDEGGTREKKLQFGIALERARTRQGRQRKSSPLGANTPDFILDDKGFCRAFPLSGVAVLTMAGLKDAVVYTLLKTLLAIFYVVSHVYDYLSYPVSEDNAQVQIQLLNLDLVSDLHGDLPLVARAPLQALPPRPPPGPRRRLRGLPQPAGAHRGQRRAGARRRRHPRQGVRPRVRQVRRPRLPGHQGDPGGGGREAAQREGLQEVRPGRVQVDLLPAVRGGGRRVRGGAEADGPQGGRPRRRAGRD